MAMRLKLRAFFRKSASIALVNITVAMLGSLAFAFLSTTQGVEIRYRASKEVGDEIVVRFPSWISEEAARESFRITPAVDGQFIWIGERRELHFVPYLGLSPATAYRAEVSLPTFFASLLPISETQTIETPEAAPSIGVPVSPEPKILEGKYLDVNLRTMVLTLFEDGKAVDAVPVAGNGNPLTGPTPRGRFQISVKHENHLSNLTPVWMPWSMRLFDGYYIHAWPFWKSGERVLAKYSLGCLRLYEEDARRVFAWTPVRTPVVIHDSPGEPLPNTAAHLRDGNLAREASDSRVYLLKHAGEKRFKRHVRTPEAATWYPYFLPFWETVRVVPDGTLDGYTESRRLRVLNPRYEEARGVFQIDEDGVKHRLVCDGGKDCVEVWREANAYPDDVYEAPEEEVRYYPTGPDLSYPAISWPTV